VNAEPKTIAVRAPNWLGDAVLSLPALRDLRAAFPAARLEVVARPAVAPLYGAVPALDGIREVKGLRAEVAALRGFDVGVLFTNSLGTALAMRLAGVRERWGYARDGRGLLLTRAARRPAATGGRSQVFYYRAMLEQIGVATSGAPDASLTCPEAWRTSARALLGGGEHFVGVAPGAAYGGAKRWPAARFAAAAGLLARERGARVVVVGTAAERPAGALLARECGALDLCGRTSLPELVGVLAQLDLLLTNDSGPMHVAAALGTPVVATFGPTDWRETAPFGGRTAIAREPVECAPCRFRECPIDHRCMERLEPARVAETARALLRGESGGRA
jgi:heptosyltransferase-2